MNASQLRFEPRKECSCCVFVWLENVRATHGDAAKRALISTLMYTTQGSMVGSKPNVTAAAHLNEAAEPLNRMLARLAGDPVKLGDALLQIRAEHEKSRGASWQGDYPFDEIEFLLQRLVA